MKRVGFTGTSKGMSAQQKLQLRLVLSSWASTDRVELHHGDCVGADAEANLVGQELGCRVVVHPPADAKKRAWCDGDEVWVPRAYLVRNHDIVDATEVLVAAPLGPERLRSGTWATVRYARKEGKEVILLG